MPSHRTLGTPTAITIHASPHKNLRETMTYTRPPPPSANLQMTSSRVSSEPLPTSLNINTVILVINYKSRSGLQLWEFYERTFSVLSEASGAIAECHASMTYWTTVFFFSLPGALPFRPYDRLPIPMFRWFVVEKVDYMVPLSAATTTNIYTSRWARPNRYRQSNASRCGGMRAVASAVKKW